MQKYIQSAIDHLTDTNWTYLQHLKHSVTQSNKLIVLAVKSYIHGIFPCFFIADGPKGIYAIYQEIKKIRHIQKLFKTL